MSANPEMHAIEITGNSPPDNKEAVKEVIHTRKRIVRAFGYLILYPILIGIIIGAFVGGFNGGFAGACAGALIGSFFAFWFCSKTAWTAEDADDAVEGVTLVHDSVNEWLDVMDLCLGCHCLLACGGDGDGGDGGDGGGD
eukprot:g8916.t1